MRKNFFLTLMAVLLFSGASLAYAWTGPTQSPPGGNVSAPLNTGTTAQSKNGSLGVNESTTPVFPFEVNGSSLLSGSVILNGSNLYLNFGGSAGSSGYGIRDSGGVMQYKNSTDPSWTNVGGGGSGLAGSGSTNYVARWTGAATLATSTISDDGLSATANGNFFVLGTLTGSGAIVGNTVTATTTTILSSIASPQYCIGASCITSWPSGSGVVSPWSFSSTGLNVNGSKVLKADLYNVAVGNGALANDASAVNTTAVGINALNTISGSAPDNTAIGASTLQYLTVASYDTAVGAYAGQAMVGGGSNTAVGYAALTHDSSGFSNAALGFQALYAVSTGTADTATGVQSLISSAGSENTANGYDSLGGVQWGDANTAVGYLSIYGLSSGSDNTAVGSNALSTLSSGSNNIAIGYNAQVPNTTSSNQIRLGNTSITYLGAQVALTVTSDRRLKTDIATSTLGLDFINSLHPVQYVRINETDGKSEFGFIAQDVQQALINAGATTSGMISVDDSPEHIMSLRYNDLFAPIVEAIQEISAIRGSFHDALVAWLGDPNNGLAAVSAQSICLTDGPNDPAPLCVTKAQVEALLASAHEATSTSAQ